ncbi:MAG: hypothetical protein IPL99_08155 [Candidatus Competibacteraceae bacterium]|nr:hypothetical protein [Candidatus Competibacteraceae bacterium]
MSQPHHQHRCPPNRWVNAVCASYSMMASSGQSISSPFGSTPTIPIFRVYLDPAIFLHFRIEYGDPGLGGL